MGVAGSAGILSQHCGMSETARGIEEQFDFQNSAGINSITRTF
jgi:hypothetical protein